jgi:hypothetical protein
MGLPRAEKISIMSAPASYATSASVGISAPQRMGTPPERYAEITRRADSRLHYKLRAGVDRRCGNTRVKHSAHTDLRLVAKRSTIRPIGVQRYLRRNSDALKELPSPDEDTSER